MALALFEIFKSKYCKIVFLLSLILVAFLVPKKVFYSYYIIIGVLFILLTSLIITCFARSIKERIFSVKSSGGSILGMITAIIGFSALHLCTVGAPVCGAYIGLGFLAILFPGLAVNFLEKYSILILIISMFIQVLALKLMGCLKVKRITTFKKS